MSLTLTKKPTKSELIKLLAKEYKIKSIYYKTKLDLLLEILDNELKSTKNHYDGYSRFLKLDIGKSLQYLVFNQKYHRDCFNDEIKCDCSICEDYEKNNIGCYKLGKYGNLCKKEQEEIEAEYKQIDGVDYYWDAKTDYLFDKDKWDDCEILVKVGKLNRKLNINESSFTI